MHCSICSFHSLWSSFQRLCVQSNSPVKLNATGPPGSESRERREGVGSESGGGGGLGVCAVCVQEGYRLCVFVVKRVCLVLVPFRRQYQ